MFVIVSLDKSTPIDIHCNDFQIELSIITFPDQKGISYLVLNNKCNTSVEIEYISTKLRVISIFRVHSKVMSRKMLCCCK